MICGVACGTEFVRISLTGPGRAKRCFWWMRDRGIDGGLVIAVTTGTEQPRRAINTVNARVGIDFDNGFPVPFWARNLFGDGSAQSIIEKSTLYL